MALSNWDTFTIDQAGTPTEGDYVSPGGVEVTIYKNWLYIRDPKAWRAGGFTSPTVMQITSGIVHYYDVEIVALRGPQNGVYVCAYTQTYAEKAQPAVTGMLGVGVYGYDNDEWVGVLPSSLEWFAERLAETRLDDACGIMLDVPVLDIPTVFRTISLKGERYNQGDAHIARQLGLAVESTPPGEAAESLLTKLLRP